MPKSLNRVQLIGNLTRDPELRYTPSGTAVCSFSVATNRSWTLDSGEKKDETEFHRIVAWSKLAEICSQFLTKGRKVFVEGRLTTRSWTAQDGTQKNTTEIVISDMILLDNRRTEGDQTSEPVVEEKEAPKKARSTSSVQAKKEESIQQAQDKQEEAPPVEDIAADDIPF
ncbi:MAG: hypothetical protein A3B38_00780 [Candidatus Levybacteria bacterium RIFCSPLOWO2_01_FULL_36_13]|nr:MAG: hypothetical protein A2684_02020 [Candidatus Levybacteria bacterium RIFCSPHIGHO2_01_FULL_36_15b]OGH35423.1 MAG: hypothetical protein A3B38_00780 [Candidatus Levybacteria bacterium RIFCSPLOWO2_01_FULL_36_13]